MNDFMRRITAIGRPLDPSWPTNRAVLVLIPVGAVAAWGWAAWSGGPGNPLAVGALGGAMVLVAWALGRELAPDRQAAAFVCMGLGWLVFVLDPRTSLLLPVLALVHARLVNRTTGLPPTWLDTLGAVALAGWAVVETGNPLLAVGAHVAFVADATLPGGLRRHLFVAPAVLVLGFAAGWGALPGLPALRPAWEAPGVASLLAVGAIGVVYVRAILATRRPESVGDETGDPLDPRRVRGGMWVALAVALPGLALGDPGVANGAALWAILGGAGFGVRTGGRTT